MSVTLNPFGQMRYPERTEAVSLFRRILVVLVGADLVLILINILVAGLRMKGLIGGNIDAWLVFHETSIGSYFTYLKWAVIVLALAAISLRHHKASIQLVLAMLFVYILIDDTLQMHEFYGAYIAEQAGLGPALAMPGEDVGQLIFLAGVGALFATLAIIAYFVSAPVWRRVALPTFGAFLGLAFFGVVVDAVHSMTNSLPAGQTQKILDVSLAIFEDGGEMIFASILVALAVSAWRKPPLMAEGGDADA